jgi:hypothetical protein
MASKICKIAPKGQGPIDYGYLTLGTISRVANSEGHHKSPFVVKLAENGCVPRWYLPEIKTLRVFPTESLYCLLVCVPTYRIISPLSVLTMTFWDGIAKFA